MQEYFAPDSNPSKLVLVGEELKYAFQPPCGALGQQGRFFI